MIQLFLSTVIIKIWEIEQAVLESFVKNAIVVEPAYFNDSRLKATRECGATATLM